MDQKTLDEKVKELRGDIIYGNGRLTGSSDTGSTASGNASDSPSEERGAKQSTGRRKAKSAIGKEPVSGNAGSSDNSIRSNQEVARGKRSADNRSVADSSSASTARSDIEGIATRGRLVKDDAKKEYASTTPTVVKTQHRKPGRPSGQKEATPNGSTITSVIKDQYGRIREEAQKRTADKDRGSPKIDFQFKNPFKDWFKDTEPINDKEAEEYAPKLGKMLVDYSSYLDQYLQIKVNDENAVFFSDLSYEEGEVLARVLLRIGKNDVKVAMGVRTIIDGNDYLSAIVILWPRIMKMVEAFKPEPVVTKAVKKQSVPRSSLFGTVRPLGEAG